jgi:hypothetical protein
MGRKIVLTGTTLTDPAAPRLATIDRLESPGSLYLIDMTHPTAPMDPGVPAHLAVVPNIFGETLGALASGDVHASMGIGGGINNAVKGKIERSSRGGLHVIVAQATPLAAGDGARIKMPDALLAYIKANPTHDYYASSWDRLTRANLLPDGTSSAT